MNHIAKYITLILLSFSAIVQGTTTDSLTLSLSEVTITATQHTPPVITPQTLSGKQILDLASFSVADAVRYFAGVQIKDYGGIGGLKTIDLRSMGTQHLTVFYDGVEIGNAQNGTVDLGKFSMDNLEQVALYNGQKTNGLQAAKDFGAAGTLYLQTKKPHFQIEKAYNLTVGMKAGTFGLANPSLLYEQKLTDNLHLSLSAEYQYAHGRYHFRYRRLFPDRTVAWDTTAIRQNADISALRTELALFGYLPNGKWHARAYFYGSQRGIPCAIVNNVWYNSQRQSDRNTFLQAALQHSPAKAYQLQLLLKYSNDALHYLNPDTTLLYIDNHFLQHELYLSFANRLLLAGNNAIIASLQQAPLTWDISLSADYQLNHLNANLHNFPYPTRHTLFLALANALDYKYLKAQASLLATIAQDQLQQPNSINHNTLLHALTPAIFLNCQPYLQEQLFLQAFIKQNYRLPTFNDLYYTDIGSVSLKPEQCTQYNGGIQYNKQLTNSVLQQLSLQANGYFNQIKNKIVAIPKGNSQYRWTTTNIGYVEIRGLDLNANLLLRLYKNLTLNTHLTYTYQKAQDLTHPTEITYGGQIAYIPWHSGSVAATLKWQELTVNYSFIYVGQRYHNSANIVENYEPPYYTHDLSIAYLLSLKKHLKTSKSAPKLQFAIEINNLFNQQYEVILNYPMPGINGKATVKLII